MPARVLARPDMWLWGQDVRIKTPEGYFQPRPAPSPATAVAREPEVLWHPPLVWKETPENRLKRKLEESVDMEEQLRGARGIFSTALFRVERLETLARSPSRHIGGKRRKLEQRARAEELALPELRERREKETEARRNLNHRLNDRRTDLEPMYGEELVGLAKQLAYQPR